MSSFADVLLATTPDGDRVFSDEAVEHALPLVLLMLAFPLEQMPERARDAFLRALQGAQVAPADDVPALHEKLEAYYREHPVDPQLMSAAMAWIRQELRDHANGPTDRGAIAARLGLDSPKLRVPAPRPAGAVSGGPLARFALEKQTPKNP